MVPRVIHNLLSEVVFVLQSACERVIYEYVLHVLSLEAGKYTTTTLCVYEGMRSTKGDF